jgi:hypothetical protein
MQVYTTAQAIKKWKGLQTFGCVTVLSSIALLAASLIDIESGRNPAQVVFAICATKAILLGLACYPVGRIGARWFHG